MIFTEVKLIKNFLGAILLLLFCTTVLALSLRGIPGNPTEKVINKPEWQENGPFELSPERGRFALTLSLVENKSFYFSVSIARFALPDLGYKDGNYVSLFAPGISFLIIPGFLLGKTVGLAQVGSFAVIALFAILNAFLIRAIAVRLGANSIAATLGALVFLFATPAFTYAVTLYQHHISTFLILLSIYTVLRWNNLWSLGLVWFLFAAAIPIDYPNLILMLPIGIYALGKMIYVGRVKNSTVINVKFLGFLTFLTAILPLAFFLWFNQASYNNPFQLSGTVMSIKGIDEKGNPIPPEELGQMAGRRFETQDLTRKKTAIGFFKTRNLLNGFYIHFLSPDRGIIHFAPIVLFGLLGMYILYNCLQKTLASQARDEGRKLHTSPESSGGNLGESSPPDGGCKLKKKTPDFQSGEVYKKNQKKLALFLGIIGANILLYSMWGDPWGGWAFGSRYLIPSYALAGILISLALSTFRKNLIFLLAFFLVTGYSVFVNELGAITTSANPPKVEVLELEKLSGHQEKYTYERNFDYLKSNRSKSFVWQTYGKNWVSAFQYFGILYAFLILVNLSLIIILWRKSKGGREDV